MALRALTVMLFVYGCAGAAIDADETAKAAAAPEQDNDDLKTAASNTYTRRFSDYGGYNNYGGYNGYGVTGYGLVDDKYNYYGGNGGYDNAIGYGGGYSGYPAYNGYGAGYSGYNKGYGSTGYGGIGGYGGYGGYGGNGGLNSYYGYNNPAYQSGNHLGYGYYGKRGYGGNIYSNGITPSLVTGYRGYSRR
ncbi:pupal cuticle protein Edg-91 [Plutella xylostella]|uniref:pupal cuticle protein Edg-91 n=1 Tax=Plutella xylostella TaxID=51655 RepID=UPI00203253D6|nr:pupal cuticle protein Edg-91 [Plutella xylostella]XP_048484960.1 pupal cuticle protein Edg-91 [Plutella xylostella]